MAAGVHPLVVSSHGSDILRSGQQGADAAPAPASARSADLVTAPAEHVADGIRTIEPDTRWSSSSTGSRSTASTRSRLRCGGERTRAGLVRVVSARGLDALYHTDDVIRAIALLRERGVDCVFDLAGRGSEEEALRSLAGELGVGDRVVFHGHVPERQAEKLIAGADVYASVADSDGVSIALFEAMALGPVPLLSDIRANRLWVRDGENGLLVEIEPNAIADGIQRALELDRAEVRRRNLEIVKTQGDRQTNLVACEAMLAELVGGEEARQPRPRSRSIPRWTRPRTDRCSGWARLGDVAHRREPAIPRHPEEGHLDLVPAPLPLVLDEPAEIARLDAAALPVPHRLPHESLVRPQVLVLPQAGPGEEMHRAVQRWEDAGRDAGALGVAGPQQQEPSGRDGRAGSARGCGRSRTGARAPASRRRPGAAGRSRRRSPRRWPPRP